ncbi:cytokine-dependent hematopoietic cell linker [Cololabis saira]|uniref:cytokine-dependent hematopoietic cell linker n=1 Tax=Cololabis saira TaxID=129043 RepID=UPI002AD314E8|nr:cytokine-dependent hematopoietic cell linker [Cololabis saira]
MMDPFRVQRNRSQTCPCCDKETEHEYDVVADHQQLINVHILPARPINDDQEYADRDCPRLSSPEGLSADSPGSVFRRCPLRQTPPVTGPAINRNLKPNRKTKKQVRNPPPLTPEDQPPHRSAPSPPRFTLELAHNLSEVVQQRSHSGDVHLRKREIADSGSHIKGQQTTLNDSNVVTNHRHSLDLETQDFFKRSEHFERVPSRRQHHEWPQTKEDIDQRDFHPTEKPQTYCEGDWYVEACSRTDAEHALHLVNKDGAFLVRDCSLTTTSEPLVLVVYHEKKVFNVKIRFSKSTGKYALGTGQRSSDEFDSVAEIIKFHSIFPIVLIRGRPEDGALRSRYPENCVLTYPITKADVGRLLQ